MKYLLLICGDESLELTAEQNAEMSRDIEVWVKEADSRGRQFGQPLRQISDATTVRVRGGETLISDGPFAETKEQIGGLDIIDCANLDEAIELASKHPVVKYGTIEVRPFDEDWPN
jgi:hypothetical protein